MMTEITDAESHAGVPRALRSVRIGDADWEIPAAVHEYLAALAAERDELREETEILTDSLGIARSVIARQDTIIAELERI